MKKRIQIVTWLGNGNFGTSLQAYALYRYLNLKGYDCEILKAFNYKHFSFKSYIKMILQALGLLDFYNKRKRKKNNLSRKLLKLYDFFDNNIKQVVICTPIQYKHLIQETDVFCVGSDQVWNAYYNFSPFNFLDFAGDVKRISYASSMGTKDFPAQYQDAIRELLMKFTHISLREKTGRDAVAKLTGRDDIKAVLDPTFLLESADWKKVAEKANFEISLPKDYMLVYLIGNNSNYVKQVENLKNKTRIKNVILIPAAENPDFGVHGSIVYADAAVSEFVSLIANATWVCTDSFHATAISINLGKNFTEFLRFKDSDRVSQNSRIYDVLSTFGLMGRLYNNESETWAQPIDFSKIAEKLSKLREDSVSWLINAIEK